MLVIIIIILFYFRWIEGELVVDNSQVVVPSILNALWLGID